MLGRGVKHELLLLRFLGKVPKSGETTTYAPAILQTRVENCWDLPVHSVATVVNPSEGLEVQRIARRLFGSLAGRSPSLTSGTKLRDHELGVRNRLGRWMTTDLENCSTREGISAKAKDDVSNAGGSSPLVENTAPTTEDSTATGADFISQGEDRFVFDAEFADPKDLHAKAEGFSISDELVTEGNMVMADSGGTSQTTPEDLLTNLDDKVEDPKKLDSFAPIFSKAVEEFQQARGHPAKVYVHIKSLEKIKPGQLANVRSAGLPVKRSLYTVNRSPHVDKKARDQFEMKVHRHLLVIETETHRLHQKLTELKNHDLPGVQLKVTFQYQTRLDRSLLG